MRCVAACAPQLRHLCIYDSLAWDFPLQLPCLAPLTHLVSLKLCCLGAPGLDPSAQFAVGKGLMALSCLTCLQDLTIRWLFGR